MQGFRRKLQERSDRIRRGAYLASLDIGPVLQGQICVTARWVEKDGSEGKHVRVYSKADVFRYNGPMGTKLKKQPCRFADELIQELLRLRGAMK